MSSKPLLTVGEVSRLLSVPEWKIRRAVDSLEIEIPRAGNYRLIPREELVPLAAELHRRNWMPEATV